MEAAEGIVVSAAITTNVHPMLVTGLRVFLEVLDRWCLLLPPKFYILLLLWKSQIIDYLNFKKLTAPSAGKEPDEKSKEDWKELDKMTLELVDKSSIFFQAFERFYKRFFLIRFS